MEDPRIVTRFFVSVGVFLALACVALSIVFSTFEPVVVLLLFALLLLVVWLMNLVVFAPVLFLLSRMFGREAECDRRRDLERESGADGEPRR